MVHEIVLLRHGETAWSKGGQHTGRTDVPLTDTGRRQAARLAGQLAGRTCGLVLTSPLARAADTCRLAGLDGEPSADAVEWDYGAYEGRTTPDIRRSVPGWTVWDGGVPDGETIDDVTARADRVLDRLRAVEGDAALVSHGHFLRVLAARWIGLEGRDGRLFRLDPATTSVLGFEREQPVFDRWNA